MRDPHSHSESETNGSSGVSHRANPGARLAPLSHIAIALPRRERLERFQPDLLAWRGVGMQRLRKQAACLEGQATRPGDLVVVPVPHVTKLELQLLVLLLEAGNLAGRLSLGRLGGTL